jgi:hypothetical protein
VVEVLVELLVGAGVDEEGVVVVVDVLFDEDFVVVVLVDPLVVEAAGSVVRDSGADLV